MQCAGSSSWGITSNTHKDLAMEKVIFYVCLGVSIVLGLWGFVTPPRGVIDGSVLIFISELFAFASLATGYRAFVSSGHHRFMIQHKDTTMEVSSHDEDNDR